jgi:hypothetical protein
MEAEEVVDHPLMEQMEQTQPVELAERVHPTLFLVQP